MTIRLDDSLRDFPSREAQKRQTRQELDARLLEGLQGPAGEMTEADREAAAAD